MPVWVSSLDTGNVNEQRHIVQTLMALPWKGTVRIILWMSVTGRGKLREGRNGSRCKVCVLSSFPQGAPLAGLGIPDWHILYPSSGRRHRVGSRATVWPQKYTGLQNYTVAATSSELHWAGRPTCLRGPPVQLHLREHFLHSARKPEAQWSPETHSWRFSRAKYAHPFPHQRHQVSSLTWAMMSEGQFTLWQQ